MELLSRASYRIDSKQLRKFRIDVGLTQSQLAVASGYTPRLIRKAESSGRLSGMAIEDIVQALNERGSKATTSDLLFDDKAICVHFMRFFELYERATLDFCSHYLSDDFTFHCAGGADNPLSGTFEGKAALQVWINRFFDLFCRAEGHSLNPRFSLDEHHVVACYDEVLTRCELTSPKIWINLHFEFRDGMICRMDYQYDTQLVLEFLVRSMSRLPV